MDRIGRKRVVVALSVLMVLSAIACGGTARSGGRVHEVLSDPIPRWRSAMDALQVPGVAVAVVARDGPLLVVGLGRRNIDENLPVTHETQVAQGSRDFMSSLQSFRTVWSDLKVLPLTPELALASFTFRDSILTSTGELIQSQGSTTLLWERRGGEWRMRFGDADHYPISP